MDTNEEIRLKIKNKLSLVPEKPGSYQMKNKDGLIIYVGKAKNLKRRLKSYFTKTVTGKTLMLVNDIYDFDYIVTSTELESLILEITLIKKYNPKYNILLKDDKSYPYIELTKEKYPRLKIVRNVNKKKNKSRLFGPYPNVTAARQTVNMLNRLYPLRKCENLKKDLCLYYHIGECLGYCKKEINSEELDKMLNEIASFLKGNSTFIEQRIKDDMMRASENLNYERALELKQMLDDINVTLTKQKIDLNKNYNFDLVNFYKQDNFLSISIFFIREGLLFGKHSEIVQSIDEGNDDVIEYIINFYDKRSLPPKELIVCEDIDMELLKDYMNIKVSTYKKGQIKKLLDLAKENAIISLNENIENIKRSDDKRLDSIKDLETILNMDKIERIELFDNSHLFGTFYVGGLVVFDNFLPNKNEYRKFKIDMEVKDDLSAMREVIYRRYYRLLLEKGRYPDLLIVDGGELQVSVAEEIIDNLHLPIKVIGLKKDDKHRTNVIVNDNMDNINIDNYPDLFVFLSKMQNEVHNFVINYHRNIRSKGSLSSLLDMVEGIGNIRKKELLKRFGSLKKMKEASIEELTEIIPENVAIKLHEFLKEI